MKIKLSLEEISGIKPSIEAMRLPMKSEGKSDSKYENGVFKIGENDLSLAKRLVLSGDEHGKFIRGINASLLTISIKQRD